MYVCICRNIKESDYPNREQLIDRLSRDDLVCGSCIEYCCMKQTEKGSGRGFDARQVHQKCCLG